MRPDHGAHGPPAAEGSETQAGSHAAFGAFGAFRAFRERMNAEIFAARSTTGAGRRAAPRPRRVCVPVAA